MHNFCRSSKLCYFPPPTKESRSVSLELQYTTLKRASNWRGQSNYEQGNKKKQNVELKARGKAGQQQQPNARQAWNKETQPDVNKYI